MSREIKFRAWDNENEYYLYDIQDTYDESECCFGDFLFEDERYVVEQFTGLKDVNGEDIYGNDLVSLDPDDLPYKVIFDEGKFEIVGNEVNYDLGEEFMDCVIVGNVHEDKDLLGGQTND